MATESGISVRHMRRAESPSNSAEPATCTSSSFARLRNYASVEMAQMGIEEDIQTEDTTSIARDIPACSPTSSLGASPLSMDYSNWLRRKHSSSMTSPSPYNDGVIEESIPMMLRLEEYVAEKVRDFEDLARALNKKDQECEHLRQVMKELSLSRASVATAKVEMQEQLMALQNQYAKVMRVAELARAASKQSSSKLAKYKRELAAAQEEAAMSKKAAVSLKDKNKRLKQEMAELRAQLAGMQGMERHLPDRYREGVCVQEYSFTALGQLY